ncbi:MAG: putative toxin-antitoxin system toxin component, PIN family [Bacteroidales bacterium]|nr:putative toxin-antitoxin system toxin component, PIN family [Bacteroidales bacterium]MBR6067331.1 putative toxin-antitoxin system toxin component, PIN family [Bacteroidales bacterium]
MMNIVLDTNCLLMSLSRRSRYYPIWRNFVDGKYSLCITNEILTEYEEILTQKIGAEIASNVIKALLDLPNTKIVQVYYHLHLITADPDDDKFVDCAFKSNAKYIVTQDHHYDVLNEIPFPYIEVVDIDEFLGILTDSVL